MTERGSIEGGGDPAALTPGLDALLVASLQDCPDAVLVRDDGQAWSARVFTERVQSIAVAFGQCGLRPGEKILLVMTANLDSLACLFAVLRAGFVPALVSCHLGPIDLAAHVRVFEAVALAGPTHCGSLALGEDYLSAAALCDTVRLVATLGPHAVDGAVDFSATALAGAPAATVPFGPETPVIATFAAVTSTAAMPAVVTHQQADLFAAALRLIGQAGINPSRPLLTTLVPATLAGLVAGPFAALIGAAGLTLHGPFQARAFLSAYDAEPGTHLVAPVAIGAPLREALAGMGGSCILVSRFVSPERFQTPPDLPAGETVVDLYAFGEDTVVSRQRLAGVARSPFETAAGRSAASPEPALDPGSEAPMTRLG